MAATDPSVSLSIIIVNWNTQDMLRECLQTVVEGVRGLDCEVIVVDNASTDGSPAMVRAEFPDFILIENERNLGFSAANNQAMRIARGRHVLLLNSDTLVHGDVLPASVAYMDSHPDVGAFGCRVLNTDGTVQKTCSMFPSLLNLVLLSTGAHRLGWPKFAGRYQMNDWARDSERDVEVIFGCYLMVRREVIEQVGMLDEAFFFYGEETDWCRRIGERGWKLRFAPAGTITHHGGGSVRSLNFRRNILLANGIVRLQLKHSGRASAALAWLLLGTFALLRVPYWGLRSLATGQPKDRERYRYYLQAFCHFSEAWPGASPRRPG